MTEPSGLTAPIEQPTTSATAAVTRPIFLPDNPSLDRGRLIILKRVRRAPLTATTRLARILGIITERQTRQLHIEPSAVRTAQPSQAPLPLTRPAAVERLIQDLRTRQASFPACLARITTLSSGNSPNPTSLIA